MTKRTTVIVVLILTIVGVGVYFLFQSVKEMGFESCALSIESAFGQALDSPGVKQKIVITNEWRTLDEQEERYLFDMFIAIGRTFDCYQFPEYADGTALRGDKGRIKARRDGSLIRVRIEVDDGYSRIQD